MSKVTPAQAARALEALGRDLPDLLRDVLRFGNARIGANAVGRMRDAKGEGRRAKTDRGPLRILTGTHAAAVAQGMDGPSRRGGVARVSTEGARATLEKGMDLAVDGGGHNEVRPDRARFKTLEPAAEAEADGIRAYAEARLTDALRRFAV